MSQNSQVSTINQQPHAMFFQKRRLILVSGSMATILVLMCILNLTISGHRFMGNNSIDKENEAEYSQDFHGKLIENKGNSGGLGEINPRFDLTREESLLVFVHIQKTGGTGFGKHLLKDLKRFSCPCTVINKHKRRHCKCYHPGTHQLWYFSRYTRGWICGVHPDYTTLTHCLPQLFQTHTQEGTRVAPAGRDKLTPDYLYITFIRDPIQRYLSEFRHTRLGAKWPVREYRCKNDRLQFSSIKSTKQVLSPCVPPGESDWREVVLEEFMKCELNPAANRMTRMLADLTDIKCNPDLIQDRVRMEEMMLNSAKRNLERFAYFGLIEYQTESQTLFERTFGVEFSKSFEQQETHASSIEVNQDLAEKIRAINHLDVELYRWAKELFLSRLG